MSSEVLLVIQLAIGALFLRSSIGKGAHPGEFIDGLANYRLLPRRLVPSVAVAIILLEAAIGTAHLSGVRLEWAAPASVGLLLAFACAMWLALRRGEPVRCMCFGAGLEDNVSKRSFIRLALLGAAQVIVWSSLLGGAQPQSPLTLPARQLLLILAYVALVLTLGSWTVSLDDFITLGRKCAGCAARAASSRSAD
jgi:hypothetical protein